LAIVVGGYNSSNTSHLVELCESKLPTFYIENDSKIKADGSITHYMLHDHMEIDSVSFLPNTTKTRILITSGASCPDAIVEQVIIKILGFFPEAHSIDAVINHMND
jgi:4-hydroxy-3-methylbut-2-enyl diphosphate reductase